MSRISNPKTTLIAALSAVFFLYGPAFAGSSDWAVNPGGRMRVVALAPDDTGLVRGIVQIEPTSGWITYWREPGEAGVPPQLTLAPEGGIALSELRFPPPVTFDQNGIRDIGYEGPVALPFTAQAEPGQHPDVMGASVFIGVCKEICVPFQADFSVPLPRPDDADIAPLVDEAVSKLPEPPSPDFAAHTPVFSEQAKSVALDLVLPRGTRKPELYLTGPEGYVFMNPVLTPGDGENWRATFALPSLPHGYDPKGKTWRLLAIAGERAMETPLVFD